MKISTTSLSKVFCGAALGIFLVAGSAEASAAKRYFKYDGIVYEISGNKLKCPNLKPVLASQIPTLENENNRKVDSTDYYTGDIVLPEYIDYQGPNDTKEVRYTISEIGVAFQEMEITSLKMSSTITKANPSAFKNCTKLTKVELSPKLTTLPASLFEGCTALIEATIPSTVTKLNGSTFKGCTSLAKVTFEECDTELKVTSDNFINTDGSALQCLKELYLYRQLTDDGTVTGKPFYGKTTIEKVVLGSKFTTIPDSYFAGASALESVTIEGSITSLGTSAFANTALTEFTVPSGISTIPSSVFSGCTNLTKVVLSDEITGIDAMAFRNTAVKEINLSDAITYISDMAFQNANLSDVLVLPASLKTIGNQAFAGNANLTEVQFGAAVASIGDGAFMNSINIAKFSIDAANETFATDGSYIADKAITTIYTYAPKSANTEFNLGTVTTIAPYAFYNALNLETVELPACYNYGNYAFYNSGIKSLAVKGLVGRYVAQNCHNLKTLSVEGLEIPTGIAAGCENLETVNLPEKITVVKQEAFKGTTALKSLNLGSLLSIIEANAFESTGITNLTVGATYPAVMPEGVFTNAHAGISVNVPVDLVETYKAAEGWKFLNIVGDANVVAGGASMGMPSGLYYAGEDGNIHCVYADGQSDSYDVGGLPHTFQLVEFANRIYGACAGKKFYFSSTATTDGDGKLFYISQVDGENLLATVLDNAGNNAYKDPFGLYIYGDDLYVNDRNVCLRKIPANGISLPVNYPSFMENNWMGFYNMEWAYGCIKAGFAISQVPVKEGEGYEPLYWVGMKYNGNGIFRFRQSNIGTSASEVGSRPTDAQFLTKMSPILTTFTIDEKSNHLYVYIDKIDSNGCNVKGGIYRLNISDLEASPNETDFWAYNPVLVDGAPVYWEGSDKYEHVGIPQLSIDKNGEYMYWCHRAASADQIAEVEGAEGAGTETKYKWAETYDATNPRHQDCIKRIKLGEDEPTVEIVATGVRGYGVVAVNYEGSEKPGSALETIVAEQANFVNVANGAIVANEDAAVEVFDTKGLLIARVALAAGESFDTAALENGVYVVVASANGKQQVVKFAK